MFLAGLLTTNADELAGGPYVGDRGGAFYLSSLSTQCTTRHTKPQGRGEERRLMGERVEVRAGYVPHRESFY